MTSPQLTSYTLGKAEHNSFKIRDKTSMFIVPLLFNIILVVLAKVIDKN